MNSVEKSYQQRWATSLITGSRTAMNDRGTSLIVLFLGAPHALEGAEGGQDRTSDPDRVLALRRCDNLDLSGLCEISLITKKRWRRNEPSCWQVLEPRAPYACGRRCQGT